MLEKIEKFYAQTPVLVTGGAGFIGSHIVEQLVKQHARVTVLDNLSTGTLENLASVWDQITFIKDSITNFDACLNATWNKKAVFHLAACTSVPASLESPAQCHMDNITGTSNLLEASRINKINRFIFSSSAAVYGNQSIACHERLPCTPESPYGYSKLIGELLCQEYSRLFSINTVMLRYFNVFGNRRSAGSTNADVISAFKKQLANNLPITVYGDGLQKRDFVSVKKIVEANLTCAAFAHDIPGEIFNVATGQSITLLELVAMLQKEFPAYNLPIQFAPSREGDIKISQADCSKYRDFISQLIPSFPPDYQDSKALETSL